MFKFFFGVFRPADPEKGHAKSIARKIFAFFHSWFGRFILATSLILTFSGIDELSEQSYITETTEHILFILYGSYLIVLILSVIVFEIRLAFVQQDAEKIEEPGYTLLDDYELND